MNQKSLFSMLIILAMVLLGTACGTTASAQKEVVAQQPAYPVEVSDTGLVVSEELPGGIVNVAFTNKTEAEHMVILARFNEGVTVEQFNTALAAEDPMAAFALIHWLGGTSLTAKAEQQMIYDLTAGQHVLLSFGEQGPQTAFFQVTDETSAADRPIADVKAELKDFAVIMTEEIKAGPQTWHIENTGGQWHEMQVVKLNEGVTTQEAIDFMSQGPTPAGPPPFEPLAFIAPLNPGEQVWTTIDLEPGVYTIICALPDIVGGPEHSHAHLGMVRILTVTQ